MDLPHTPSFGLGGRRALVTGASSGIGLACAAALARSGAAVTLCARRVDRLSEIQTALQDEGHRADTMALDLNDVEATQAALLERAPFDVLLNAAGMARHAPTVETTTDDFDAVMGLNLRAAYFLTQAVGARLIQEQKPGSLINISSQMGHVGGQDRAVYCASKHAIEGMTKAMAIEWGPQQIRVNTICPTFVLTDLTRSTFDDPDKRAWINEKIKLGRPAEVEDITGAAVYLASDASAMVTGTSLLIDGGWTAG